MSLAEFDGMPPGELAKVRKFGRGRLYCAEGQLLRSERSKQESEIQNCLEELMRAGLELESKTTTSGLPTSRELTGLVNTSALRWIQSRLNEVSACYRHCRSKLPKCDIPGGS
jgi:hypothetical protein